MTTTYNPECRDGKHRNCNGVALDVELDEFVPCTCSCHVAARPGPSPSTHAKLAAGGQQDPLTTALRRLALAQKALPGFVATRSDVTEVQARHVLAEQRYVLIGGLAGRDVERAAALAAQINGVTR